MSRQAKAAASRLKRTKGFDRIIICEEVYDYQIGSAHIAIKHPATHTSFTIPNDFNVYNAKALKKAIHGGGVKFIPAVAKSQKRKPLVSEPATEQGTLF